MAEEIVFIVNDTQESVSLYVDTGDATGVDSVNEKTGVVFLQTDDIPEVTNLYYTDARVSANTDVAANTVKTGITAQQAADITANNAKETNARFDDRLNEVGNVNAATLALDFDLYEGWNAVVTEALTLSITNGKFKVVTLDLTGDFAITYPANSTVVGDTYDGTVTNTLTIHYRDASNILIIVTQWV